MYNVHSVVCTTVTDTLMSMLFNMAHYSGLYLLFHIVLYVLRIHFHV